MSYDTYTEENSSDNQQPIDSKKSFYCHDADHGVAKGKCVSQCEDCGGPKPIDPKEGDGLFQKIIQAQIGTQAESNLIDDHIKEYFTRFKSYENKFTYLEWYHIFLDFMDKVNASMLSPLRKQIAQLEERLKAEESKPIQFRELLHSMTAVYTGLCYRLGDDKDKYLHMPSYVKSMNLLFGEDDEIPESSLEDQIAALKQSYDTVKAEADRWRGKCEEAEKERATAFLDWFLGQRPGLDYKEGATVDDLYDIFQPSKPTQQ